MSNDELEKAQGVPTAAGPAPGPPPRPGLEWDAESHRWIRPEDEAIRTKVLAEGQYSSDKFREGVRNLKPEEQVRLGKHLCWDESARRGAYFSNMSRESSIEVAKYLDKVFITDMNDPNFLALEGAAEDMMRNGADPEARKIAYETLKKHPIPKTVKFIEEAYGRNMLTGNLNRDIDSAVSGYEATAGGPQANWLMVAADKIFNGKDTEHNEMGIYSYRFPEQEYYDVVKKLYDQTQEFYKKKGITHITLYRGLTKHRGEEFTLRDSGTLTSWTTDKSIATFHAKRGNPKDRNYSAYIMTVNMPVENILYSYETVPQLKTKTFRDIIDEDSEFVVVKKNDQKLFKAQGVAEQPGPPPGPPPSPGLVWESTSHRWTRPEESKEVHPIIKVVEDRFEKQTRLRRGYTKIILIDARKFMETYEKERGEKLAWSEAKAERLKDAKELRSYPLVSGGLHTVGVGDGRHRIAEAARQGAYIEVAMDPKYPLPSEYIASEPKDEEPQPNRFYPMLSRAAPTYSRKLDEVYDQMTDAEKKDILPYIKFMNMYAKLAMDQYEDKPTEKVTNKLWDMISSSKEANDMMAREGSFYKDDIDKANAGNEYSQVYLIDRFVHAWHTEGGLNVWKVKLSPEVHRKVTSVFRDIFDELAGERGEGYFRKGQTDGQGDRFRVTPDTDDAEDKPVVRAGFDNVVEFDGRKYVELGNTFRTDVDVEPGAVIEVSAQELVVAQNRLSWDRPRVSGVDLTRATPFSVDTTLMIAQRYSSTLIKAEKRSASQDDLEEDSEGGRDKLTAKAGESGTLTIDEHLTFLDEDAAKEFIGVTSYEAWNSTKQRFSRRVGSIHSDVRINIKGTDFLQGFTATIGGMKDRNKLLNHQDGDRILVPSFKAPTPHGKMKWQTDVGQGKAWIFEPGEIGSPGNRWSAIFKVERKAKVTFGRMDDQFIEMKMSGTRHMPEGRWVIMHAPVEPNRREWLLMMPKKQEYDEPLLNTMVKSEKKSLLKAVLENRGK